MERLPQWQKQLTAFFRGQRHRVFAAGQFDCAIFAGEAVMALTGKDFVSEWAGQYESVEEGLQALKDKGFDSHIDYVASVLPEIHPSTARAGDLGVVQLDDPLPALGVYQGETIMVLGAYGLRAVDRMTAQRAFKVG